MRLSPMKGLICQALICLLLAFNTYPAMQTIIADAMGAENAIIPICTLNGIEYISLKEKTDSVPSEEQKQTSQQQCFYCFANHVTALPPFDTHILGRQNAYSERLAVAQYQNTYFKKTILKPHTRGPPTLS